jgi:hypothetical protein
VRAREAAGLAALLALASCAGAPPAPPIPVHQVSRIAGRWEGRASPGRAGEPVPATLVISPEGSFELTWRTDAGTTRSTGRLTVQDGRVWYRDRDGRSGSLVLYRAGGVAALRLTGSRPPGMSGDFRRAPSRSRGTSTTPFTPRPA